MITYPFHAGPIVPTEPTREGWRWHRLTDLARLATGHTPSRRSPEYWNGDIPWLQLPDIRALDGRVALDTSEHITPLGIENSAAVLLPPRTVCLSRTASVGFVTITGRDMATSQDFVNWVCGPDLDPDFLMHLLIACRTPIRDLGSGAVHHTIYFPTVESFNLCIPSLPAQRRMVAQLARWSERVQSLARPITERLAAARALAASFLGEAFERARAQWEPLPLGAMVHGNGQYGTSQRSNRDGKGIPVLGMSNIHEGRIRWHNLSFVDLPPAEITKYRLAAGDILFNRTNSAELVGKTAIFDGSRDTVFASYLIRYRALDGVADPDFICSYINSPLGRAYIARHMARAIGQVNISASTMHRMPIPCPPHPVQQRLATRLRHQLASVDALVTRCQEDLAAAEALPAALLRAAFVGRQQPHAIKQ